MIMIIIKAHLYGAFIQLKMPYSLAKLSNLKITIVNDNNVITFF